MTRAWTRQVGRRGFLIGAGTVGLAGLTGYGLIRERPDRRPLALVYRGPAASPGCPEAVAHLLETAPEPLRAVFCGPDEEVQLTAEALSHAVVYAQPGGGTVSPAWRRMRAHTDDIRAFVRDGGNYLGFCLGAYLAGTDHGFGILPREVGRYIDTPDAEVDDTDSTVLEIDWRNERRHMFFQDGPLFTPGGGDTVLARYRTGSVAALITEYGAGRVGVVGPHPEADSSWYTEPGLTNPDGIEFDLGHDLIASTLARG